MTHRDLRGRQTAGSWGAAGKLRTLAPVHAPTSDTAKRRAAYRFGLVGEALCAIILLLRGYRLHARRARTPFGEVDLIASRNGRLVFLEVKSRRVMHTLDPEVSVGQMARVRAAALHWVRRALPERGRGPARAPAMRFDIMRARHLGHIDHCKNAF